ncbi:MAG: hypothetical protein ACRCTU_17615 [Zoogloea sp.]|uniref:hypothetical protein n=1 Tax=Zoogloea sp. TaxID=49181 RepID=UPI003F3CC01D
MAKLAKLEYEQKSGKLVDAQEQFRAGAKLGSTLLAGLYNMPERLADDFAGMSNPHEIATLWTKEIDILVQDLRRAYGC